ncbi:MAG: HIT domain-containing protein [Rickettsiales bacterium]
MAYDSDNVFAKILRGELPCNKVYEDDYALAFHDIAPEAPIHVLVVPKGKYLSFDDFVKNADSGFVRDFFQSVQKVAEYLKLPEEGYRIISNHGEAAAQSVSHFHVHIIGGKKLGRLLP